MRGYPRGIPSFISPSGREGLERAAPVGTLVQKLRAGEQFLARGRVHRRKTASGMDVGFLLFCFAEQKCISSPFRRVPSIQTSPVAVPDKIFGLTLFLDFIDRCHSLRSLLPPHAALSSLPLPAYAALRAATIPQSRCSRDSSLYTREPFIGAKILDNTCLARGKVQRRKTAGQRKSPLQSLTKIVPGSAAAACFFQSADDLFDLHKALGVVQSIILYNGFDLTQCMIALQLCNFLCIKLQIWKDDLCVFLG